MRPPRWPPPRNRLWGLFADIDGVFAEGLLLVFLKGPGSFEMVGVKENVDGVMHVAVAGAVEVSGVFEIESERFGLGGIARAQGGLIAGRTVVREL